MALKRPYLEELIAFIKQQPHLDIAIVTGATREYVDVVLGAAAPELLSLAAFIWTRDDEDKFLRRGGNDYYKTLRHIPELMGYQLGKILMVEHKRVDPPELHLQVSPFIFFPERPELVDQDNGLANIIRRLDILLQVDNILKLRQQEDEQRMLASQKRADWAQAQGISLFNDNYSEIMSSCPIPNFKAIDE